MADFGVGDTTALQAGASAMRGMDNDYGWQPISSAPREGTIIETKNSYGVAPTYCLARWTAEVSCLAFVQQEDGSTKQERTTYIGNSPSWQRADSQDGGNPMDGPHLTWRPYKGDPAAYVDPTGGLQNSMAYWRGAVAAKYGLPLDHFEKQTARNIAGRNEPTLRPTGLKDQADDLMREVDVMWDRLPWAMLFIGLWPWWKQYRKVNRMRRALEAATNAHIAARGDLT